MKVSFEGIGEMVVTFDNGDSGIPGGKVVKMAGNSAVAACGAGEVFMGLCLAADESIAAVQTEGYVKIPYSGTEPQVGYARLSADGEGGVKSDESGREYLVVDVDSAGGSLGLFL